MEEDFFGCLIICQVSELLIENKYKNTYQCTFLVTTSFRTFFKKKRHAY